MPQRFFLALTAVAALSTPFLAAGHASHGATPAPAPRAAPAGPLPLRVVSAVVVAVPPGIRETSAFLVLHNPSRRAVVLKAATTPVAGHTALMVTTRTGAMSGMRRVATLTVPAGGTLKMGPAGDHVMLMALKRPLRVGETLTFTLTDVAGRAANVRATVKKP